MATPESKVKEAVKRLLNAYKPQCWYFMPRGTTYGTSGIPDFICCMYGNFFAIETKAGKNKPTTMQNLQMSRIRESGGTCFVINENNLQELIDYLEDLYESANQNTTD